MKYSELTNNLKALGIYSQFEGQFPYNKFDSYLKVTNFVIYDCLQQSFNLDVTKHVDTRSNLNSEVLQELVTKVGIDNSFVEENKFHIDSRLLKYRNAIAHGERTDNNPDFNISKQDFYDLYDRVNICTDHFETLLLNHIEMETYKAS